jgi:hypothetical protein
LFPLSVADFIPGDGGPLFCKVCYLPVDLLKKHRSSFRFARKGVVGICEASRPKKVFVATGLHQSAIFKFIASMFPGAVF